MTITQALPIVFTICNYDSVYILNTKPSLINRCVFLYLLLIASLVIYHSNIGVRSRKVTTQLRQHTLRYVSVIWFVFMFSNFYRLVLHNITCVAKQIYNEASTKNQIEN